MRTYTSYSATRQGCAHSRNEDRYYCPTQKTVWGAVFDGITAGGGGNVASTLSLESMRTIVDSNEASSKDIISTGLSIIRMAQKSILAEKENSPCMSGTGTTAAIVCVDIQNNILHWFSIGDSAIMLCQSGKNLVRLTTEDSTIGRLIAEGKISLKEARKLPQMRRHELVRYIGMDVSPDEIDRYVCVGSMPLKKDDIILVCSDGLSGFVPTDQIRKLLKTSIEPAYDLVDMAVERYGSNDDTTAVVIKPVPDYRFIKKPFVLKVAIGLFLFASGFVASSFLSEIMKEKWHLSRQEYKRAAEIVIDSSCVQSVDNNNNSTENEIEQ